MQKFSERISVVSVFDSKTGQTLPRRFLWRGRQYSVDKVGLYHRYRVGRNLIHVFSLNCGQVFARITLDSQNLNWKLEELEGS